LAFRRNRTGDSPIDGETGATVENRAQRIFQKALRILAVKPRSEAELRERLLRVEGAGEDLVTDCMERLRRMGYINDRAFAESFLNQRTAARPLGRRRLERELANKKVSSDTARRALDRLADQTSDEVLIDRAIAKRLRSSSAPSDRQSARRWFSHLARLGFEYELIARKLRELNANLEE
jgi:regulatory protein